MLGCHHWQTCPKRKKKKNLDSQICPQRKIKIHIWWISWPMCEQKKKSKSKFLVRKTIFTKHTLKSKSQRVRTPRQQAQSICFMVRSHYLSRLGGKQHMIRWTGERTSINAWMWDGTNHHLIKNHLIISCWVYYILTIIG